MKNENTKPNVTIVTVGNTKHGKKTLTDAIAPALEKRNSKDVTETVEKTILVVSAVDGPMPQTEEALKIRKAAGAKEVVVFMNKVDLVDDGELLDIVETEIREVLSRHGFSAQRTPIIRGSATGAIDGEERWVAAMDELIEAIDK